MQRNIEIICNFTNEISDEELSFFRGETVIFKIKKSSDFDDENFAFTSVRLSAKKYHGRNIVGTDYLIAKEVEATSFEDLSITLEATQSGLDAGVYLLAITFLDNDGKTLVGYSSLLRVKDSGYSGSFIPTQDFADDILDAKEEVETIKSEVETLEQNAAGYAEECATILTQTQEIKSDVEILKNETQTIKDTALSEIEEETENFNENAETKTAQLNAIKDDCEQIEIGTHALATEASEYANNAEASATSASTSLSDIAYWVQKSNVNYPNNTTALGTYSTFMNVRNTSELTTWDSCTLAFFIKQDFQMQSDSNYYYLFAFSQGAYDIINYPTRSGFSLAKRGLNGIAFSVNVGTGQVSYIITNYNLFYNEWKSVVMVADKLETTTTIKIYINGEIVKEASVTNADFTPLADDWSNMKVGATSNIKNVGFWQKALSEDEVQNFCEGGMPDDAKVFLNDMQNKQYLSNDRVYNGYCLGETGEKYEQTSYENFDSLTWSASASYLAFLSSTSVTPLPANSMFTMYAKTDADVTISVGTSSSNSLYGSSLALTSGSWMLLDLSNPYNSTDEATNLVIKPSTTFTGTIDLKLNIERLA